MIWNILDADNPGWQGVDAECRRHLVIEFEAYPEYDAAVNPGETITAEVILLPTGTIKIQNKYIAPGIRSCWLLGWYRKSDRPDRSTTDCQRHLSEG